MMIDIVSVRKFLCVFVCVCIGMLSVIISYVLQLKASRYNAVYYKSCMRSILQQVYGAPLCMCVVYCLYMMYEFQEAMIQSLV